MLRISGGHRFVLKHGPKSEIKKLNAPLMVALSLRHFAALKPKVLVREGQKVQWGDVLVLDKHDERIGLQTPACGTVQEIRYLPRRVLDAIIIKIDFELENSISSGARRSIEEIASSSASFVEDFLLNHGLWPFLDVFPDVGFAPIHRALNEGSNKAPCTVEALHINLFRTEPHGPDPLLALANFETHFLAGLLALGKLAEKTFIYVKNKNHISPPLTKYENVFVEEIEDKYPADHLGVQAYYRKLLLKDRVVLGADVEFVKDVGHLLLLGKPRLERLFALSGNGVFKPQHVLGRLGMSVTDVLDEEEKFRVGEKRILLGGIFSGKRGELRDYLGPKDNAVHVMIEDQKRIPLVFFRAGWDRLSLSRAWASSLFKNQEREATTSNNGEERACIQCGYCADVCPIQLFPSLIMKASVTKDIEKMEYLSINDCVQCGLCTFVCPSKIELGQLIEQGKKLVEKENQGHV